MNLKKPFLSLIVAMGKNREIGAGNELLWHLRADLKMFKQLTTGNTVLMGRKTFESIGKPLPNRRNVVITRGQHTPEGTEIFSSVRHALDSCSTQEKVFVIGGGQIYEQSLSLVNEMYITHVDASFKQADTFFPLFDLTQWTAETIATQQKDEQNEYDFTVVKYTRL